MLLGSGGGRGGEGGPEIRHVQPGGEVTPGHCDVIYRGSAFNSLLKWD